MPPRRSSPPEVMTWGRARPVIIVAGIFDALQLLCEFLWIAAPTFVGILCTSSLSTYLPTGGATAVCAVAGAGVGYAAAPALMMLGNTLGMAVAFIGWLSIGFWLLLKNSRIFPPNILWFGGSLLVEEIPILGGVVPSLTLVLIKMYRTQIAAEKALYEAYQAEQAALLLMERRRQEAFFRAQAEQEDAANEAYYASAANDEFEETEGGPGYGQDAHKAA